MAKVIGPYGRLLEGAAGALLRPWLHRPPLSAAQVRATDPQRILLVRPHDQIGDMICATPAFSAIRDLFPGARITLVCMPRQEAVVRHHPAIDAVLTFDKRRFNHSLSYARGFLRALRAVRADGAFVLNSVSFSSNSALIAGLSGADWIVGGDAGDLGWGFPRWLYSLCLPFEPVPVEPAVEHALRQLRRGGFELPSYPAVVRTNEAEDHAAARFLAPIEGPLVGIHPGAGKMRNRWPVEHMARLVREIQLLGRAVWLVEGPADRQIVEDLCAEVGVDLPRLRGVDLCVVGAALRQSEAVVVNDTGVMHLAGAVGARGVALFGPTPAAVWAPRGDAFTVVESTDGTMASIPVESVLSALGQKIGRGRDPRPRP